MIAHENSCIDITGEKLQCLKPGAWLNDEVIFSLSVLHASHKILVEMLNLSLEVVIICIEILVLQVINLYFELLKEREKREPQKFLKCHFFNTFFYKKVCILL